jgi:hypothetical protein
VFTPLFLSLSLFLFLSLSLSGSLLLPRCSTDSSAVLPFDAGRVGSAPRLRSTVSVVKSPRSAATSSGVVPK